jgi:hypothetical protein
MPIYQSDAAKGLTTPPNAQLAGVEHVMRYPVTIPATGVLANDIFEVACIPPGTRVTEIIQDSDDLDTNGTPTIAYDIGIMSGVWRDTSQSRTVGAEFYSGSTLARTGGVDRPTLTSAYRSAAATTARSIGIKINALAATPVAGTIGLTVRTVTV